MTIYDVVARFEDGMYYATLTNKDDPTTVIAEAVEPSVEACFEWADMQVSLLRLHPVLRAPDILIRNTLSDKDED